MDLLTQIMLGLAVVLGCLVGSFIATMVIQGYGYSQLNFKITRLENTLRSAQGVQVRNEKSERMTGAMAEAMQIMQNPDIPKEDKTKAMMGLAAKYPDVAFDLIRKIGVKGLL